MLKQSGDTILLVENEEAAILLVQQAVASCPGELYLAVVPDSVAALDWLSAETSHGHPVPRLILLDLKLPKLLGLAVLRTLRMDSRLTHVPIVVYSDSHEPSDVVLSYQIGANSFVRKPENLAEFSQLMRDLIELGWLDENGMGKALQQTIHS
ncbi:response regulator [Sideroxyarcus sp. TK5]|jgi:two-component system response regulator